MKTNLRHLVLAAAFAATIYTDAALAKTVPIGDCVKEASTASPGRCRTEEFSASFVKIVCQWGHDRAAYSASYSFSVEGGQWTCDRKVGWEYFVDSWLDLF